jgi:hypothetical protein
MAFPTTPKPRSVQVTSLSPNLVSEAHSMKRQVRSLGVQKWVLQASYPPMTRTEFAPLWAFVIAQKGRYSTFSYTPEKISTTTGTATGTLAVSSAASAGVSTISASGLTGTLKAGDFVKFSGHSKVYMLTADATTSLAIEPPLISAVATTDTVTYNNVPFTCALSADSQGTGLDINEMHSFSLSLVEVI